MLLKRVFAVHQSPRVSIYIKCLLAKRLKELLAIAFVRYKINGYFSSHRTILYAYIGIGVYILLGLRQTFYRAIITEIERKYCFHMHSQFDGVGVRKIQVQQRLIRILCLRVTEFDCIYIYNITRTYILFVWFEKQHYVL